MTKEEISARQQQAAQFHAMGYNCAQSVACAFADKVDLDKVALFKVTEGLGLGMGGMNGTWRGHFGGGCAGGAEG